MANWITHMMIADRVYPLIPGLDWTGFCIGNIAPDCNVENADWTVFTPPREATHWMSGDRKGEADCERFYSQRINRRIFASEEERAFFLGYYSHLLTDACFQRFIRDEQRVEDMLGRIRSHPALAKRMIGQEGNFDGVKRAFGKSERMRDIDQMEYEYLERHQESGYLTVLRRTHDFPDYLDYLPKGAIVRKLDLMAVLPEPVEGAQFIFFTRDEYRKFVDETCELVVNRLRER